MTILRAPRVFPPRVTDELVSNGDIPRYDHAINIERAIRCLAGMGHHVPTICRYTLSGLSLITLAAAAEFIPLQAPVYARDLHVSFLCDGDVEGQTYTFTAGLVGMTNSSSLTFRATGTLDIGAATWLEMVIPNALDADSGKATAYQTAALQLLNTTTDDIYLFAIDIMWPYNGRLSQ